eukprot:CAMPEP_0118886086 /NCGR_PEP_ID=MMETSP1163-20130328/24303_1 /TAXON_ID=124430 /ORGANISM="Phaeomonas parva, Strain CCMP2877" /LENGTH=109 /DNA_ID=CAMNT_0006824221 /DNA_START=200 /DNA_END=525 /DNA_ORIENTATION=+
MASRASGPTTARYRPTWLSFRHCLRRHAEVLHTGTVLCTFLVCPVHGGPPLRVQGNTQAVDEARAGRSRRPVPRVELLRRLSVSAQEPLEVITCRSTASEDRGPKAGSP